MAEKLLPAHEYNRLVEGYRAALEKLDEAPDKRVIVAEHVSMQAAKAFAEHIEKKGFQFVVDKPSTDNKDATGSLSFFKDPTGPHESAAWRASLEVAGWVNFPGVFSGAGLSEGLLEERGASWCDAPCGSFYEPDASLYLLHGRKPNVVVEVAYAQPLDSLLDRLHLWTSHRGPGPARVVLGVKIEYRVEGPPQIDVCAQLAGQQSPSATVRCGAGSGCLSPCMYDYTLFLSVSDLLFGAPWTTRILVSLVLAVLVPAYRTVWGGLYAACDVLRGRRSMLDVASACVRSLRGPWWGVVPVDAFSIRGAVFRSLSMRHLMRTA